MNGIPGQQRWTLHIRKDGLKFAAAHMTVFPDGSKENLHGHNYQVELTVDLAEPPTLARMLSYERFKQALRTVCGAWDEKVLIAGENRWLEPLAAAEGDYAFRLCGKRYVLPADEVAVLPLDNITAENLAQLLCERFWAELLRDSSIAWSERVAAISLRIDESPGQGATYAVTVAGHPATASQ
ncbi:MAG: hypothetical protein HC889_12235 [Synechococcaceae cyanobacterium SM1_2_3]|nr:hypothetical protein [Synechococcaceae cyanobacterium SM1_2_3]